MNKYHGLDLIDQSLKALEIIGELAKAHLGAHGPEALAALHAIAKVVETVEQGFDGKATLEDIRTKIDEGEALLHKTIAANDAAAEAAADAKFGPEK